MKKAFLYSIIPIVIILSGCATKGRLSVIDIDLRTPEQITAYQKEAEVVYQNEESQTVGSSETASKFSWDVVIKLVEVIKGRVRVLSFEWVN
jgi:hypothetical protein